MFDTLVILPEDSGKTHRGVGVHVISVGRKKDGEVHEGRVTRKVVPVVIADCGDEGPEMETVKRPFFKFEEMT